MLNNCTLAKQTSGFLLLYVSGPKKHGVQQSISDFGKSNPDWARGIGQQGFPGSISQMNLPMTDPFWRMEVYLPMDCLPYKINYSCNIYNRPMDPMITTTHARFSQTQTTQTFTISLSHKHLFIGYMELVFVLAAFWPLAGKLQGFKQLVSG